MIAFHERGEHAELLVSNDLGDAETLSASLFFRSEGEFEVWESEALRRCGDRVLDVGAGVGAHALILQDRGHRVTALEALTGAVRIMEERGVKDVMLGTLFDIRHEPTYDTVLILMNGSMLAETLTGLDRMLERARGLLLPGGTLLLDSTDLRIPRDPVATDGSGPGREGLDVGCDDPADGRYVGELHFQLSYGDLRGEVFPQLFVDPETLEARARTGGWQTRVVWTGEDGRFLAQLTPI